MHIVIFLILFPLLPAALIAAIAPLSVRKVIARVCAAILALASVHLAFFFLNQGPQFFAVGSERLDSMMLGGEIALAVYLLWWCKDIKRHEIYVPIVIGLQTLVMIGAEFFGHTPAVERSLYVDNFSIIMALIVGIIGSLTCVYSIGYMTEYSQFHPDVPSRRRMFFFVVFVFLSSMFGVIFSNNLIWMFFFWEITTLCSFLLIGYPRTEKSQRSAYRALGMNSAGGLAFACAIFYLKHFSKSPTLELDKVLAMAPATIIIPAVLICFAGIVKAGQMPFSSWLLGAMVAPTPVSALLHASTMVKAGVFVVVKFAPVLQNTLAGSLIALLGGVTFLATSVLAVTERDAKRVLAYSTIANLGLIVMCAGVGTSETVWAAILLIVFHAVAKALLFLTVGPIEHRVNTRDIERMEGLIVNRPALGVAIIVGILGMFLAPFGMLIGKYACLKALLDSSPLLAALLAFGSGPTLFFWAKWLGKVASVPQQRSPIGRPLSLDKWVALTVLTVATLLTGMLFPLLAKGAVEPYLQTIYSKAVSFEWSTAIIMIGMMGVLFVLPMAIAFDPWRKKLAPVYLAGANASEHGTYLGALGRVRPVAMRNYYLTDLFEPAKITRLTVCMTAALLVAMFWMVKP